MNNSGTFKDFQTKYHDLLSRKILKLTDVNFVVERDVQVLDYADFMAKHADASCKRELVYALQPDSREVLRIKCLAMVAANPAPALDEVDKELLRRRPSINELAIMAKDWNEFIKGSGTRTGEMTDPAAVESLKRLFLAEAYKREIDPRVIYNYFPEEARTSIQSTMTVFELELIADGQLPISQVKWAQINQEEIVNFFPLMNSAKVEPLKQKLRDHYLTTLSSAQLKSEEFKRRREACGITPEMIENAQGSVRSECQRLPYLGAGGFREKFGNKHLNDGSLTPELLDKIRAEFRAAVPAAEYISNAIYDDALILGLGEEILVARWMRMPLKAFWQRENHLLFFYCKKHPEVIPAFKKKIVEEFKDLSIFDFVRLYKELFSLTNALRLLPTDQSASGKTFAEVAQEAFQTAGKLDVEVSRGVGDYGATVHFLIEYIEPFLTYGLLSPTNPALRRVIKTSIDEYGQKIFEGSKFLNYTNQDLWKTLATSWSQINNQVLPFYKSACTEVQKAHVELQAAKAKIDHEQFKSEAQTAMNEKWSAGWRRVETLKKEKEELRTSRRYDVERAVRDKVYAVDSKQKELIALQSALRGFPDVQGRLETQIAALESQPAPDSRLLIEGMQRLQVLKSALKTQEQEYGRQLSEDVGKKAKESSIALLIEQQRKANEAGKPTGDRIEEISRQSITVSDRKIRNERTLNPPRTGFDLYGFRAADDLTLPLARQAELRKEIEADDKKLEELQKQRAEAEQRHRPFEEKSREAELAARRAEWDLESYVKELGMTKQLEAAKEELVKKEREHRQLTERFEMFANRGEILKKLRANLAALPADIEKCRAELGKVEEAFRKAQEEHAQAKASETALTQLEQAKAREILELEAEQKSLSDRIHTNAEVTTFSARKQELKDRLDAAYQAMVKGHLATFEKMLLPEIAATS